MSQRTWSDEELKLAVENSICWADVARKLNLVPGNPSRFRKAADKLGVDYSHFDTKRAFARGVTCKEGCFTKKPLNHYLRKGVSCNTYHLKNRLLEEGLLEDKCDICGLEEWMGKSISLHLDHVNGDSSDNRVENLRILCPNCHSQTETYAAKNKTPPNKCTDCDERISKGSNRCLSCAAKKREKQIDRDRPSKIEWPSDSKLEEMVWEKPKTSVAETLGVSDKAVEKRCKSKGIKTPGRGYWQKQRSN